jgi:hypothetical protein
MSRRYFIDKFGAQTGRVQGPEGQGHIPAAREVLAGEGIPPENDAQTYAQMFRLKYARIVEHDDGRVEVEHRRPLTTHQRRFLQSLADAGKVLVYVTVER